MFVIRSDFGIEREMLQLGVNPSNNMLKIILNSILTTLSKIGDVAILDGIYEDIMEEQMELDDILYNNLIIAYAKLLEVDKMTNVYTKMKAAFMTPDYAAFQNMIYAYGTSGNLVEMQDSYRQMCQVQYITICYSIISPKANVPPDVDVFNKMITCYGIFGQLEQMEDCYDAMIQNGIHPNSDTFSALIRAYRK
jgi:pentatricopeptide repeat protein